MRSWVSAILRRLRRFSWLERRWIGDQDQRAEHERTVRQRLEVDAPTEDQEPPGSAPAA